MNVPKLRFKEFTEEWKCKSLINISNNICYGMNSASKDYDGENAYIRITDIDENTGKYIKNNLVSPDGILESKYLVKEHDILFARTGASTGKTYLYCKDDGKLYYAGFLIKANIKKEFNSDFIYQQTKSNNYKKWVKIMSMRSGQPGINSEEYGSYKFSITAIDEQIKIGNLLSLLDKKIELQSNKIEALKLYKKGLIDGLVVKENCPLYKLSDIGFSYAGLSGKSKEDFDRGNSKFITYMSVFKNDINLTNLRNVDVKDYERQNIVETGDLFFTVSSETKEEVGMCATWNYNLHDVYLNSFCFGYRLKDKKKFNNQYLCYLLGSKKLRKTISNLGQGFTRVNISKSQIMDINVNIPNIGEQNKEVLIFNLLTLKVKNEIQKQEKLEQLKKGLMQSMFI